jgi:transposase
MRFYNESHQHYCGIDLHAKTMYLCILDREGQILLHKNMRSRPEAFLEAVAPYRDDLVVAVECMFTWYWLADLCRREGIEFVLGHALYMKAIHGAKVKNDKVDAFKIATLLRGGTLPKAYVYPPEMRATRDLLRRRLHLVRRRGNLLAHILTSVFGIATFVISARDATIDHFAPNALDAPLDDSGKLLTPITLQVSLWDLEEERRQCGGGPDQLLV